MRAIILISILSITGLFAELVSVVPYLSYTIYDAKPSSSIKEKSIFSGIYTNVGTLNYLLEFNYSYLNTTYKKDENLSNLIQNDVTLAYSSYYNNFMYRVGAHYTNTNDSILGNGIVGILGLGGYNFFGYDKLSYGLEAYYSYYKNKVYSANGIAQLSPYISYYQVLKLGVSNNISFKFNYQYTSSYIQQQYLSYELSDTLIYNKTYINLEAYTGEMVSGVKNGGLSVYNSLDLMQDGVALSLGYYVTPSFLASLSYSYNSFEEAFLDEPTSTDTISANINYRF